MIDAEELRRVETKIFRLHCDKVKKFVQGDVYRLRGHLISQMQILTTFGVIPTWENFSKFGTSWTLMSKYFSGSDVDLYRGEWRSLFKDFFPENWSASK